MSLMLMGVGASRFVYDFCDTPLPLPAGTSPFHIKGEFYRHTQRAFQKLNAAGKGDVLARCDADVRAFAEQSFLSFDWYDLLPFPRLGMAEAEVLGRDLREHTYETARRSAEHTTKGIYKLIMKLMSAQSLASKVVRAVGQFYDFSPATIVSEGKTAAVIERKGVPLCVVEWWCIVTRAYIEVPLRASGITSPRIAHRYSSTGVVDRAVPVGDAILEIAWG